MAAMARHTPTGTSSTSRSSTSHVTAAAAVCSTWTRDLGTSNHHRRERSVSTTSDDCCSASGTTTTTGRATRYSCHHTPHGRKFQSVGLLGFVICYDSNWRTAHSSESSVDARWSDHAPEPGRQSWRCGRHAAATSDAISGRRRRVTVRTTGTSFITSWHPDTCWRHLS